MWVFSARIEHSHTNAKTLWLFTCSMAAPCKQPSRLTKSSRSAKSHVGRSQFLCLHSNYKQLNGPDIRLNLLSHLCSGLECDHYFGAAILVHYASWLHFGLASFGAPTQSGHSVDLAAASSCFNNCNFTASLVYKQSIRVSSDFYAR